jgi:phage terminase large subunit
VTKKDVTIAKEIELSYVPRPYLQDFHSRSQFKAILVLHRRAGKTVACINELIERALHCKKPQPQYAYVAPQLKQAKKIAWVMLKKYAKPVCVKVGEAELFVELINGARIYLAGADNPDSLRGLYLDGVVLDEVAQMKKTIWTEVLQPALSDRKGWSVFIGTPNGHDFFYQLWKRAQANPKAWYSKLLTVQDTNILSEKILEEIKSESDSDSYEQEFMCSFNAGVKGSYYGSIIEKMEDEGRLQPIKPVEQAPVSIVFDLGINDDTSAWFYQVVNGKLTVLNHFSQSGLSFEETIEKVRTIAKENRYKLDTWWVPHDAGSREWQTGKTAVEQFWAANIEVRKIPRESFQAGIQAVRTTLPKMWIDGVNCASGIEALKAYQKKWNEKNGTFSQEAIHDWSSHSADAMRYLCFVVRDYDIKASVNKVLPPILPPVPGLRVETILHSKTINKVEQTNSEASRLAAEELEDRRFQKEILLLSQGFDITEIDEWELDKLLM